MRRKVNIPIPSSDLDYGKKPYVSPTAYQGQVRKASSKLEHDNVVRQYSEFKRPQGGWESYQDMEQWADSPPGVVFPDFPVPDIPGTEIPVPDFEWGDSFICFCGTDKCYCPGQITCFDPLCTYPIVGSSLDAVTSGFSMTEKRNRVCIDAPADAMGPVTITFTLQKYKPNGKGGVTKAGTCQVVKIYDKCAPWKCCADTENMAWDDETSAETVAQSSSCIVAITDTGDGSPYRWTVSGTGFYFNVAHSVTSMQTSSKVVTLYTDAQVCGTATITVVGCAGQTVTGYVRCTSGKWVSSSFCYTGVSGGGAQEGFIDPHLKFYDQWCADTYLNDCIYCPDPGCGSHEPCTLVWPPPYVACTTFGSYECEWVCSSDQRSGCNF